MNNTIVEAVIFDMDGVVIDSRKPIEAFWQKLGNEHQVIITPELMNKRIHGCPARQSVYNLFPHLSIEQKEELLEECEVFETTMEFTTVPGVKELLTSLQAQQVPTALVTSSLPPKVAKVFDTLGLNGLFSTVVTSDLVEKGKPDPACYLLAARKLGKNPENCIVFEDAVSGVKSATGAGMFTIGISAPDQADLLKEAGAGETVPDFKEIILKPETHSLSLFINKQLTLAVRHPK